MKKTKQRDPAPSHPPLACGQQCRIAAGDGSIVDGFIVAVEAKPDVPCHIDHHDMDGRVIGRTNQWEHGTVTFTVRVTDSTALMRRGIGVASQVVLDGA